MVINSLFLSKNTLILDKKISSRWGFEILVIGLPDSLNFKSIFIHSMPLSTANTDEILKLNNGHVEFLYRDHLFYTVYRTKITEIIYH